MPILCLVAFDEFITDGEYSYTWQMGRQLQGITGTDLTTSYNYNENGLRTEKIVNGQTHEYTLLGSSVTRELIKDAAGNVLWTIHYSYAGDSTPVRMNVNGMEYYFLKNGQGDITHIVDSDGNEVASYRYDAWGNHLSITGGDIAELNPYRYRGYRYDSETGLFYVGSRYYDPEIGRFINADDVDVLGVEQGSLIQYNLFAYCLNNPVNRYDEDGYLSWPNWATKVAIGVGVIALCAVVTVATGGAGAGVAGFIAAGALKGAVIGAATGAAIGAGAGAVNHRISTGSWKGAGQAALDGGANGFMTGAISGAVTGAFSSAAKVGQAAKAWDASSKGGPLKNMSNHYSKHVVSEGNKSIAKNVVNYTNNAKSLWSSSNGIGTLKSSGSLFIKGTGVKGFYSPSGLIRSFMYQ